MSPGSVVGCAVILVGCTTLAVGGQLAMRRIVNQERLRKSHEVGGYLLSVVGTLYAVLLGLVVVDSMTKYQNARENTEREADALVNVYILASRMPNPQSTKIMSMCKEYADSVVATEWTLMKECTYCEEARHLAVEITKTVLTIEPATENQKAIYPELVSDTNSLWQCRRARISTATHGVPAIEWFTLIAGGAITVFFTYFFGLESLRLQLIMTAMVVILIALNLVLVLLFGYPFQGDLAITNEAFMQDYKIFNNRY